MGSPYFEQYAITYKVSSMHFPWGEYHSQNIQSMMHTDSVVRYHGCMSLRATASFVV